MYTSVPLPGLASLTLAAPVANLEGHRWPLAPTALSGLLDSPRAAEQGVGHPGELPPPVAPVSPALRLAWLLLLVSC